jgi:hypothetical protein
LFCYEASGKKTPYFNASVLEISCETIIIANNTSSQSAHVI